MYVTGGGTESDSVALKHGMSAVRPTFSNLMLSTEKNHERVKKNK